MDGRAGLRLLRARVLYADGTPNGTRRRDNPQPSIHQTCGWTETKQTVSWVGDSKTPRELDTAINELTSLAGEIEKRRYW